MECRRVTTGVRRGFVAGRLRMHILPVLVWIGVLAIVIVLLRQRAQRFEVFGVAQGRSYQVAATINGRLKEVPVQLFDKVRQGGKVAVMDAVAENENLQGQLKTALAEVEHLKAQLAPIKEQFAAERANLDIDKAATLRRFMVDVESARLRTLQIKALLAGDRIMMNNLIVELRIAQSLREQGAITDYEVEKAQAAYDALAKKVEENEDVLEQAMRDFVAAQKRLDEYGQLEPQVAKADSSLEVIRKAINVQEQRVAELQARREPLVLRAPISGVVSLMQHRAGEAVLAGEPILTIVEAKPSEVVAYVRNEQLSKIRENTKVELIKTGKRRQVARSQVVYLGPVMELMPERLWGNPNIPQWGRPMLIKIPPSLELLPGELVGIREL